MAHSIPEQILQPYPYCYITHNDKPTHPASLYYFLWVILYVVSDIVALFSANNVTVRDCSWRKWIYWSCAIILHIIIDRNTFISLHFHYSFKIMWITVSDFSKRLLCCNTQSTLSPPPIITCGKHVLYTTRFKVHILYRAYKTTLFF